jgi:hypothetical protein
MKPKLGQKYSRREISDMVGGSTVAYLPYKAGEVLCGCFDPSPRFNPTAPEEVLFGSGPIVEETAEMVSRQRTPIPIFIYRAPSQWEYVGNYRCVGLSRDKKLLKQRMQKYPERGEIVGALQFERV